MEVKNSPWITDLESLLSIVKSQFENMVQINIDNIWKEIANIEEKILDHYKQQGEWNLDKQEFFRAAESRLDGLEQNYPSLWRRIKSIEEHLKEYHEIILGACPLEIEKLNRKIPHKCPVCDGKRLDLSNPIPGSGGLKWDVCLICKGKGIVWG